MLTTKTQKLLIYGYSIEYMTNYSINNIVNIISDYYILPFYWNKGNLTNEIILINNKRIAKYNGNDRRHYGIVCDIIFDSGIHYYTIKIIEINKTYDIMMGYVPSNYQPKKGHIGNTNAGWSLGLNGLLYNEDNIIYAKRYFKQTVITIGDIIKCQANFNNKSIKYYLNNIDLGIAFNNLNGCIKPGLSMFKKGKNCIELIDVK